MRGGFNTPICVGGQDFLVVIDTGSSDLGISSSGCPTCAHKNPLYKPKGGSTAKPISYGQPGDFNCDESHDGVCAMSTGFADGSGFDSELYWDEFSFGTCAQSLDKAQAVIGSVYKASETPWGDDGDGLLGLAYPKMAESLAPTPFDYLVKSGAVEDIFAFALCHDRMVPGLPAGRLVLGGDGAELMRTSSDIQWTPIVKEDFYTVDLEGITVGENPVQVSHRTLNKGGVIVDTGCTANNFPGAVYNAITEAFFKLCDGGTPIRGLCHLSGSEKGTPLTLAHSIFKECTQLDTIADFPDITFQLKGATIKMPARSYLRSRSVFCPDSDGYFLMDFDGGDDDEGTMLGDTFLVGQVTVFDRKNKRVGFARIDEGREPCDVDASTNTVVV